MQPIKLALGYQHWYRRDRMSKTTIHHIVGINGTTLIVFHNEAHCWQFRLISAGGAVFGERKIYYSAEAALKAGLDWIAQERN